jgi:uncharacterized protein YqjF (DUF2071 family)
MLHLKDHPFNVETFFDTSLVLTYAIPKNELGKFIPECLTLDTFHDKWAFIAIALVKTRSLRPKGFPEFMGNDFILAGFRVFVRYKTNNGKDLRGLYILKSETNKKKMEFWGNIFTHYNYTTSDIDMSKKDEMIKVYSKRSGLNIEVTKGANIALPEGSPFGTWNEARRYAGPLPFTFTYDKKTNEVLIIEGVRENWKPEPVKVLKDKVKFITEKKFKHVTLANAFVIENVPYYWKKGRKEIWKG